MFVIDSDEENFNPLSEGEGTCMIGGPLLRGHVCTLYSCIIVIFCIPYDLIVLL